MKRASDKRRAERHQQWAERRRQRQIQEPRTVDDGQETVQVETEPRQEMVVQPVRIELPFAHLFSPD